MAAMDTEKIIQDLKRRFAAPLPEFYRRRIIFWHDEDREFEDDLDEIVLEGVKVVQLTGRNTFAVKKLLCEDDTTSNYLVYDPRSFQRPDDNWLINVQLYSEEFRSDLVSIWMDEMGLPSTPTLRAQVKGYSQFFRAKDRQAAVKKLSDKIVTAAQMHLAVMSVLCGNQDLEPGSILKAVLIAGLDTENNSIYRSFITYGADKPFWLLVHQATGYNHGDDGDLGSLAVHLLLTAASRTIHQEHLAGLERHLSTAHQAYCYDLVSDWLHSSDNGRLREIARYAEGQLRLARRFSGLPVEDLLETEVFPCVHECILTALMGVVEKRRTMAWYSELSCYYDGLLQIANLHAFYMEHSAGFHTVEPHRIWESYTGDYYRMDTYYRQFQMCFQRCLKETNPLLDDLFKKVAEKAEGLYSHWFLGQLGRNWTDAAAESLEQYGWIPEVPRQADFYKDMVKSSDTKVYVIVSDALRYEVAVQLSEQLQRETQSKVSLSSTCAIFPTVTKFGMAALLPHEELTVTERSNGALAILADGQSTEAPYRDKVLKSANAASVALKYGDFIGMMRPERAALVRGMDVVYLYHDRIDEASHTSDNAVFPACEEAVKEIKNLVRIIVNEFGGIRILITADHGFLYTYSPLTEDGKVDKTTPSTQDVEIERRHLITRSGAHPDYLLPVHFIGSEQGYEAWAPRENIRIKKRGGGLKFVHGGISLQEMVVPVVDYRFLRNQNKEYQRNRSKYDTKPVELSLLSANRKISNMIFSLNFYQKEAVGINREAAVFELYFTDSLGQVISDTQKIIADKTSENGQERVFRCSFNLRSQKYSALESYYLVIADESGLQAPMKEKFQIDIAFAVDEFDFFG